MTADEWLERAFFNAATGLYDESEAGASRALAAEPPLLAVLVARARRLASDGKLTEATPLLNAAARQFPQDPVVAELLGWTLLKQRRTDDAEAAFRQALKSDPKRAAGYEGIARVERERGQHHKSSHWFRQAADREPSGGDTFAQRRAGFGWRSSHGHVPTIIDDGGYIRKGLHIYTEYR